MRVDKIDGITFPFKHESDGDIFKKPDFYSQEYVQSSQKQPFDNIKTWKMFCQPLRDTFDKVEPEETKEQNIKGEQVMEVKPSEEKDD